MKTLFLFLLFLFLSQVLSKFLFNDIVLRNGKICEDVHKMTKNEIGQLLNQPIVFSKDSNKKELCFLECKYQAINLIGENESIQENGLFLVIQKIIIPLRFDSNSSLKIFSLNTMLLCNQISDAKEPCLKAVERVECLQAMTYLRIFGFLNDSITKLVIEIKILKIMMKIGVSKFQTFFGLHRTGDLNYETLAAMYSASFNEDVIKSRRRRFVLYRNKWKKNNITYEISKYSEILSHEVVDEEISRAFHLWASAIPMNVTLVQPGLGDIIIRFEKFDHGDVPFDGPGSVLAHTFYPITFPNGMQKSFIHFDDLENWTLNSTEGVDFFQTALHEIGHSLGLKHSNVENSVMWPGHITYTPNFTLGEDDIRAIQSLYGMNMKQMENLSFE